MCNLANAASYNSCIYAVFYFRDSVSVLKAIPVLVNHTYT